MTGHLVLDVAHQRRARHHCPTDRSGGRAVSRGRPHRRHRGAAPGPSPLSRLPRPGKAVPGRRAAPWTPGDHCRRPDVVVARRLPRVRGVRSPGTDQPLRVLTAVSRPARTNRRGRLRRGAAPHRAPFRDGVAAGRRAGQGTRGAYVAGGTGARARAGRGRTRAVRRCGQIRPGPSPTARSAARGLPGASRGGRAVAPTWTHRASCGTAR
jgi:hypothetical protein